MKRVAGIVLAAGAMALSGCQTTGTNAYVRHGPGPTLEVATAECRDYASKHSHLVVGIGGVAAAGLGLMATIAATASKRHHAFEDCMVAKGYHKPGARNAQQAAPASVTPAPKAAKPPAKAPAKTPEQRSGQQAG